LPRQARRFGRAAEFGVVFRAAFADVKDRDMDFSGGLALRHL
jgi:hypothetical protein